MLATPPTAAPARSPLTLAPAHPPPTVSSPHTDPRTLVSRTLTPHLAHRDVGSPSRPCPPTPVCCRRRAPPVAFRLSRAQFVPPRRRVLGCWSSVRVGRCAAVGAECRSVVLYVRWVVGCRSCRSSVLVVSRSLFCLRRSVVGCQSAVGVDRRSVCIAASPVVPLVVRSSIRPVSSSTSVNCRCRLLVSRPSVRSTIDPLLGAVSPPLVSTLFVPRSVPLSVCRLELFIVHHSSRAGQGSLHYHESDSPLFRCPPALPLRRVRHSAPPRLIRHATIY